MRGTGWLPIMMMAYASAAWAGPMFHGTPLSCIQAASRRYQVPVEDLYALLENEGAGPGVAAHDPNGTVDLGPMQVNTCHLPFLSHYGYTYDTLKNNACANVEAGAWVFARCLFISNNVIQAAACYNAGHNLYAAWQDGYVQRFAEHLGLGTPVWTMAKPHKPGLELVVEGATG